MVRRMILSEGFLLRLTVAGLLALGSLSHITPSQAQDLVVVPKADATQTQQSQESLTSITVSDAPVTSAAITPQPSSGKIAPIFEERTPVVINPAYLQCKEDGDCVYSEGDCGALVVANKAFAEQARAALPKCVDQAGRDSRVAEMATLFRQTHAPVCRNKSCVMEEAKAAKAP